MNPALPPPAVRDDYTLRDKSWGTGNRAGRYDLRLLGRDDQAGAIRLAPLPVTTLTISVEGRMPAIGAGYLQRDRFHTTLRPRDHLGATPAAAPCAKRR